MRPIHDPINDGFDFVFPVGMATGEQIGRIDFSRTEAEDTQFWRGMNIIGCLNPEACDYTLMASPSGNNRKFELRFVALIFCSEWSRSKCVLRAAYARFFLGQIFLLLPTMELFLRHSAV